MRKKRHQMSSNGEWILCDNNGKELFVSENIVEVFEEGQKYKHGKVYIEKRFPPGTTFAFDNILERQHASSIIN
jgi:hypothetical protein